MRHRLVLALVGGLLFVGVAAQYLDFAVRAEGCWYQRLPSSERHACCNMGGVHRLTDLDGDCCKKLLLDEGVVMESVAVDHEVPPGSAAQVWASVVAIAFVRDRRHWRAPARAPPWLPHPNQTTVLLL